MLIRLFDVKDGQLTPSEHCHTIGFLKDIMDFFPKNYLSIYKYIFYMTCPDPEQNPFFHLPEIEKEEVILRETRADFYPDDYKIEYALKMCRDLYETPTARAYYAAKSFLDRLTTILREEEIMTGRDGNSDQLFKYAERLTNVRRSFQEAFKDMKEEFGSRNRGGREGAYDDNDED